MSITEIKVGIGLLLILLSLLVAGIWVAGQPTTIERDGHSATISLGAISFIEVTPSGEHFYCAQVFSGKIKCITESQLKETLK